MIQLPFQLTPSLKTYQLKAFELGIIEAHEDSIRPWIYNRYINQIEYKALVKAIKDTPKLVNRLNKERLLLEYDANQRMKYDELREDFVVNFIKNYTRESGSKELMDKYQKVYGPLTINFPCNKWRWLEEPWPWERGNY